MLSGQTGLLINGSTAKHMVQVKSAAEVEWCHCPSFDEIRRLSVGRESGLQVAQATRLCRPATRRTERAGRFESMATSLSRRRSPSFRSAGRQPERAGRPRHPGCSHALAEDGHGVVDRDRCFRRSTASLLNPMRCPSIVSGGELALRWTAPVPGAGAERKSMIRKSNQPAQRRSVKHLSSSLNREPVAAPRWPRRWLREHFLPRR